MAPRAARTVSRGRVYTVNGQSLWSVTTIIGNGLPKPAIAAWQARSVAEFAVANWRTVGAMLESVRLRRDADDRLGLVVSDPDAVDAAVDWLKGAPWRESGRKMQLGSDVHAEAEAYVLGTPRPEPRPEVAGFVASFRNFLDDFAPVYEMAEATVYSLSESYAGTLDAIVTVAGRRLVVDYKTGKDVYPDVALQLAAYMNAESVLLDDGTSVPMPRCDGAAALHLRDLALEPEGGRGYSLIPVAAGREAWDAFRYVREVMRWQEETSKGVLSQPVTNPAALEWLYPAGSVEEDAA